VVEEVRVTRLDGMIDDALCETLRRYRGSVSDATRKARS